MGRKVPVKVLSRKEEEVRVVLLGDVHLGHKACDVGRFQKTLDYILKTKNVFCILMGDLVEMVTRSQKGNMLMEQEIDPTEQIKMITKLLKPLAEKGKILGTLRDNHLQRTERDALIDMNDLLSSTLGIDYWGVGGMVIIKSGKNTCRIAVQHGTSGAKNIFMELDKMRTVYKGCDVLALGHDHKLAAQEKIELGMDENGEESSFSYWQVRTGSYLKYADYAREKLYEPSPLGSPIIVLKKDGETRVDVDTLRWRD